MKKTTITNTQPLDPLPNPLSVFADVVILLDAVGCCAVGFAGVFEGCFCAGCAVSPLPSKPQIPQKDLRQSEQTEAKVGSALPLIPTIIDAFKATHRMLMVHWQASRVCMTECRSSEAGRHRGESLATKVVVLVGVVEMIVACRIDAERSREPWSKDLPVYGYVPSVSREISISKGIILSAGIG